MELEQGPGAGRGPASGGCLQQYGYASTGSHRRAGADGDSGTYSYARADGGSHSHRHVSTTAGRGCAHCRHSRPPPESYQGKDGAG